MVDVATPLPTLNYTVAADHGALLAEMDSLQSAVDSTFKIICAILTFFCQLGFTFLEYGQVNRSFRSILFKNLADVCIGATTWLLPPTAAMCLDAGREPQCGYGFYNGNAVHNGFIGLQAPLTVAPEDYADWFFGLVFAATATTIVSGALAERTKSLAYIAYAGIMCGLIWPPMAHWVWSADGWLAVANSDAPFHVIDFAGGAVVHVAGVALKPAMLLASSSPSVWAVASLVGAVIVGPRSDFAAQVDILSTSDHLLEEVRLRFRAHQMAVYLAGMFILWFGFYGFNCGSVGSFFPNKANIVALVAANTTISTVSSVVVGGVISLFLNHWSCLLDDVLNCAVAGLVASTSCAAVIRIEVMMVIGALAAGLTIGSQRLLHWLGVDDPVSAIACHGPPGILSIILASLLYDEGYVGQLYDGWTPDNRAVQLGHNLLGLAMIVAWSGSLSAIAFGLLHLAFRGLHIDYADGGHVSSEDKNQLDSVRMQTPWGPSVFVATEIEGMSAMWAIDPDSTEVALSRHNRVLQDEAAKHGAFVSKREGDKWLLLFENALDAVGWCVTVQNRMLVLEYPTSLLLTKHCAPVEDNRGRVVFKGFRVRMSVTCGTPLRTNDDSTGAVVHGGPVVKDVLRGADVCHGGQLRLTHEVVKRLFYDVSMPIPEDADPDPKSGLLSKKATDHDTMDSAPLDSLNGSAGASSVPRSKIEVEFRSPAMTHSLRATARMDAASQSDSQTDTTGPTNTSTAKKSHGSKSSGGSKTFGAAECAVEYIPNEDSEDATNTTATSNSIEQLSHLNLSHPELDCSFTILGRFTFTGVPGSVWVWQAHNKGLSQRKFPGPRIENMLMYQVADLLGDTNVSMTISKMGRNGRKYDKKTRGRRARSTKTVTVAPLALFS
eukprot:gene5627-1006_t